MLHHSHPHGARFRRSGSISHCPCPCRFPIPQAESVIKHDFVCLALGLLFTCIMSCNMPVHPNEVGILLLLPLFKMLKQSSSDQWASTETLGRNSKPGVMLFPCWACSRQEFIYRPRSTDWNVYRWNQSSVVLNLCGNTNNYGQFWNLLSLSVKCGAWYKYAEASCSVTVSTLILLGSLSKYASIGPI